MRWNYYDDTNGGWGADRARARLCTRWRRPNIWMMYEHDDDGDEGLATSWIGCRLLGTDPRVGAGAGHAAGLLQRLDVPRRARRGRLVLSTRTTRTPLLPGKYQLMGNGAVHRGRDPGRRLHHGHRLGGPAVHRPVPLPGAGRHPARDLRHRGGADSLGLLANSKVAQVAYDDGFAIPVGPALARCWTSATSDNSVILHWAPGRFPGRRRATRCPRTARCGRPSTTSATITGREDFQGYRIYRYQGEMISEDPYDIATLVAQFDKIDGMGFDTGLPPLNEDGPARVRRHRPAGRLPLLVFGGLASARPTSRRACPNSRADSTRTRSWSIPGPAPAGGGNRAAWASIPTPTARARIFDTRTGEQELGPQDLVHGPAGALPASRSSTWSAKWSRRFTTTIPAPGRSPGICSARTPRAIASGLYIYVVEDLDTGEIQRGKLVIIK